MCWHKWTTSLQCIMKWRIWNHYCNTYIATTVVATVEKCTKCSKEKGHLVTKSGEKIPIDPGFIKLKGDDDESIS